MNKLRLAVVGVGHLGFHHARILAAMPDVELVGVADTNPARCAEVAARCGVPAYEDYRQLIPRVDAASIVVPTVAHREVGGAFLAAGKSVLIEKPLAPDPGQAEQLAELAERRGLVLQVGHIERFNPVLRAIPNRPDPPRLVEAHRAGPYSFRSTDIGVVLDLMIHDLDILLALVGRPPQRVAAEAWSVFGGREDIATAHLEFACGTIAHLTASRAAASPRRDMSVWWTDAFAQLDFAKRRSVTSTTTPEFELARGRFAQPSPREIPALREALNGRFFRVTEQDWSAAEEPLALELAEFVRSVAGGSQPLVDGRRGCEAVRLAAAVLEAASRPGIAPVELPTPVPRAA